MELKIEHKYKKLVGAYNPYANVLFIRNTNKPTDSVMINDAGSGQDILESLEDLLKSDDRRPIYEGDTITLQF